KVRIMGNTERGIWIRGANMSMGMSTNMIRIRILLPQPLIAGGRLAYFHFRGAQHRTVIARHWQEGEMHRTHPPAMMLEHSDKRRRSGDISHQSDRRRIEISGDRNSCFLGSLDDRRDRKVITQ